MSSEELSKIQGGAVKSWASGTFINSICKGIETIYKIGQSFGKSIRTLIYGQKC